MKSFALAALIGCTSAIQINAAWPSVARCKEGQIPTDFEECDDLNKGEKSHDAIQKANSQFEQSNVQVAEQIVESWPSVARCKAG